MKLNRIVREDKFVSFVIETKNAEGHVETSSITAHEAPHPEMDKAFEDLSAVVQRLMEFKSVAGITCHLLSVSFTKHGTRSVAIGFRRTLGATEKAYKGTSVFFRIDDPADGEDGKRECKKEESAACVRVIEEGLRYANGERQQMLLPIKDASSEPSEGEPTGEGGDLFDSGKVEGDHPTGED